MYSNKKLQISGSKTKFITINNNKDDHHNIKIRIDDHNEINESESLKILGFVQNKHNSMDTHLNLVASKVGMTLAKLKPILELVPKDQRKRIKT